MFDFFALILKYMSKAHRLTIEIVKKNSGLLIKILVGANKV